MMKAWYEKSINALQLNGKGARIQEAYTRAVRMLVEFYHKNPGSDHRGRSAALFSPPT
jgi:hypothetical protein